LDAWLMGSLACPLALCLDLVLGDPPDRWHPVAWCGRAMGVMAGVWDPPRSPASDLVVGALTVAVGFSVLAMVCYPLHSIPWVGDALVLWVCTAVRGLVEHVRAVRVALERGDLEGAREAVGSLVSRDTAGLGPGLVASAAAESAFENVLDSVVAPMFWFVMGGWIGVVMYRAVNTADAMFGYRDERNIWFGKVAARLDDLMNVVALPFCVVVLGLACPVRPGRLVGTLVEALRSVPSPSSWLPMGWGAAFLGRRFEKPSVYSFGPDGYPEVRDLVETERAVVRCGIVSAVLAGFLFLILRWSP